MVGAFLWVHGSTNPLPKRIMLCVKPLSQNARPGGSHCLEHYIKILNATLVSKVQRCFKLHKEIEYINDWASNKGMIFPSPFFHAPTSTILGIFQVTFCWVNDYSKLGFKSSLGPL